MATGDINVPFSFTADTSSTKQAIADLARQMDAFDKSVQAFGVTMDATFKKLGQIGANTNVINGLNQTQQAINNVTRSYVQMSNQAALATSAQANSVQRTITAVAAIQGIQNRIGNAVSASFNSQNFSQMAAAVRGLDLEMRQLDRTMQYIIAFGFIKMGSEALKTASALQRSTLEIAVFSGSLDVANKSIDGILQVASQVPFSIKSLTDAFVKLKASGIDPITGKNGEGPLLTMSNAVAAFGGSTEIFERSILAISQMAGKGVVSMEELRQQLGEALPTAIRSMAAGMDLPLSEFVYKVSKGEIEFREGFDALIKELDKSFKGVGAVMQTTMSGAFQAVKTELEKFIVTLDRSGTFDVLTASLVKVRSALQDFGNYLQTSAGQQAIEKLNNAIFNMANNVQDALPSLARFGEALGNVIVVVGKLLGSLSGEEATYGLLGYLVYGRRGAAVGVLIGPELDKIVGILNSLDNAIKSMMGGFGQSSQSAMSAVGATISDIAKGGLIGWLLIGPQGILIGALAEIGLKVADLINKAVTEGQAHPNSTQYDALGNVISNGTPELDAAADKLNGIANKTNSAIRSIGNTAEETAKKQKEFTDAQNSVAASVDKVANSGSRYSDQLKSIMQNMDDTRKKVAASAQAVYSSFDVGIQATKGMETFSKKLIDAEQTAEAGSDGFAKSMLKRQQALTDYQKIIDGVASKMGNVKLALEFSKQRLETAAPGSIDEQTATRDVAQRTKELAEAQRTYDAMKKQAADYQGYLDKISADHADKVKKEANLEVDTNKKKFVELQKQATELNAKASGKQFAPLIAEIDARAKIEDQIQTIDMNIDRIEKSTVLTAKQKNDLEERYLAYKKQLQQLGPAEVARAKSLAQAEADQANLAVKKLTQQEEYNLAITKAKLALDQVGEAGLTAQHQVDTQLDAIDQKIVQIQKQAEQGLIDGKAAAASIENLRKIRGEMQGLGDKIVQQQKWAASNAGQFWTSVGDTIENSLGGAIENLITGTKKWKDVMMDFYNSITSAVAKYLAKEALMRIFNIGGENGSGNGGFGSILSKIMGGFGGSGSGDSGGGIFSGIGKFIGSFFGAHASGADFVVGGAGATDSVPVSMMVSPGERITVSTKGQQQRSGSGVVNNWHINTMDAKSFQQFAYENADMFFDMFQQRTKLNRGFK